MSLITEEAVDRGGDPDDPDVATNATSSEPADSGDGFFAIDRARSLILMAAALTAGAVLLPTSVRWVTIPLVLVLPGHALVCAVFGRNLEFGGVRRASLSTALTLTSYPIVALSALVLDMRLTKTVVIVGTDLLVAGCAAVVTRRAWRRDRGLAEPEQVSARYHDATIRLKELIIPFGAMATAMVVALASVVVLPRRLPDEYSAIAFDGTWALVSRAVPVSPDRTVQVQFRVENNTREAHDYTVYGQVVDGPAWSSNTATLLPDEIWVGTVDGQVKPGSCRSRLNVVMKVSGDDVVHSPLTLFLRDRLVAC